jgi:hypothetical protein
MIIDFIGIQFKKKIPNPCFRRVSPIKDWLNIRISSSYQCFAQQLLVTSNNCNATGNRIIYMVNRNRGGIVTF